MTDVTVEYTIPIKDDRGKARKNKHHSHNVRIEHEVMEKRMKRFIQSVEATSSTQQTEEQNFDEFYEGLSRKEKRKFDKMNNEIQKIEAKGVGKNNPKKKVADD